MFPHFCKVPFFPLTFLRHSCLTHQFNDVFLLPSQCATPLPAFLPSSFPQTFSPPPLGGKKSDKETRNLFFLAFSSPTLIFLQHCSLSSPPSQRHLLRGRTALPPLANRLLLLVSDSHRLSHRFWGDSEWSPEAEGEAEGGRGEKIRFCSSSSFFPLPPLKGHPFVPLFLLSTHSFSLFSWGFTLFSSFFPLLPHRKQKRPPLLPPLPPCLPSFYSSPPIYNTLHRQPWPLLFSLFLSEKGNCAAEEERPLLLVGPPLLSSFPRHTTFSSPLLPLFSSFPSLSLFLSLYCWRPWAKWQYSTVVVRRCLRWREDIRRRWRTSNY